MLCLHVCGILHVPSHWQHLHCLLQRYAQSTADLGLTGLTSLAWILFLLLLWQHKINSKKVPSLCILIQRWPFPRSPLNKFGEGCGRFGGVIWLGSYLFLLYKFQMCHIFPFSFHYQHLIKSVRFPASHRVGWQEGVNPLYPLVRLIHFPFVQKCVMVSCRIHVSRFAKFLDKLTAKTSVIMQLCVFLYFTFVSNPKVHC